MYIDPSDYSWSSYQINALGKHSRLLTPHQLYQSLAETPEQQQISYRHQYTEAIEGNLLNDIRQSANNGLVLGNQSFVAQVEALTGYPLQEGKRGRPKC
jgi:putative transposase